MVKILLSVGIKIESMYVTWRCTLPSHRNEPLNSTELTVKLEPAFLCGLRCSHIPTRTAFFEVFDGSIKKNLFERLLYIMCSQNWEHCGGYFWIKHCIEVGGVIVR